MELYEQIRREYEFGAGSIIGVARKLGVHRRMVREAVRSALPTRRKKTERPYLKIAPAVAFRSHWQYEASFCTPGEGHEKGGVEGEVGYFRRNHWVPVPAARDLTELNAKLFADCRQDENRVIAGRKESVGVLLLAEKGHLLPLPAEDFDLAEVSFPRVDQSGCAKVRTNFYSVPLKPGTVVEARVYSSVVEFHQAGVRVAQHERSYDRSRQILDLEHYLDVLEQKPGALRGSKPLAEWRAQGRWPESYDRLWERIVGKQGRQAGARAMVTLIRMGREFGPAKLEASVVEALALGCTDVAAIRHLLMADQLQHVAQETIEIGELVAYERPLPTMIEYNQLLSTRINEVQA